MRRSSKLIHHPAKRRMLPVFVLDPVRRSSRTIWSVAVFRNQTLQPHQAGMPEQVRADLAPLERRQMDAVNTPRQKPRQIGLAHIQGKLAEILAVAHQHVEGVELDLVIVLAAVQAIEIRSAVDTQQHHLAVDHEG